MTEPRKPKRPSPSRPGEEKRGSKPRIFDPERQKRLLDALRAGNYQETAIVYAGLSRARFFAAMARGRAERDRLDEGGEPSADPDEALYVEFVNEVERARAEAEIRAISNIRLAGAKNWQAEAWFLERTNPQRFGRRIAAEVTGKDGGPVEAHVNVSVEDLASALDEALGQ